MEIVYGTVTVMVCRFVVAEFDEACSVSGNVIEPPPPPLPPPLCVPPAQDCMLTAAAANNSVNANARAQPAHL